MSHRTPRIAAWGAALLATAAAARASATEPTAGYPEAVIQWGVQKGETCEAIAKTLYGSDKHVGLLLRYNRLQCGRGPLPEGLTLVLPEKVTTVPDARLRSINPDVRARPPGSGWAAAASGMPLFSNYNVNTLDAGRADIEFSDRTRVYLAPNTLVVIYGTASKTKVSKTAPAAVEVQSGEVKAGLAALRGGGVEVAVSGGARVTASSRDTVVQHHGTSTTVSVFDGKAQVRNAGKTVEVPKDFATRFADKAPPEPPRALPVAPAWAAGGTDGAELAPNGEGRLSASWAPVPGALRYRFEVARDEAFRELLIREEVPGDIHSFRAEKMPPGTYYLAVRAIDKEEYLGVATPARLARLVEAQIESGEGLMSARSIDANPYGSVTFAPAPNVELALDEGPFGPVPPNLDLRKHSPRALRLRVHGKDAVTAVPIEYSKVATAIASKRSADGRALEVRVTPEGFEGINVEERVGPTLRVHLPGQVQTVPLAVAADGTLQASVPIPPPAPARVVAASATGATGGDAPASAPPATPAGNPAGGPAGNALAAPAAPPPDGGLEHTRLDVVDARGVILTTGEADLSDRTPPPPPERPVPPPVIGAHAPLWQLSNVTDEPWTSPTAPNQAVVSGGGRSAAGTFGLQAQVRASGSVGRLGLDAALRSSAGNHVDHGSTAWFGGRFRVLRLGLSEVEIAPVLRLGIPVEAGGPPARLEPALAVGGARGRWTWLVNAGGRLRLKDDQGAGGAPPSQVFGLLGGTVDVTDWLRGHLVLDLNLVNPDTGAREGRVGFGGGLEAGKTIFGGAAFRVGSKEDAGASPFAAQLAVGIRAR